MPVVLALDCALGACQAGLFTGRRAIAARTETMARGHAARLPWLADAVLNDAGGPAVDLVAVTVGPGSFTGLRAGLALAHGLAAGWSCALVGVGVAEALVEVLAFPAGAPVWVALHSRAGRVFLARHDGLLGSHALDDLPPLGPSPILAGNAAQAVAEALAACGQTVAWCDSAGPTLGAIAAVGLRRHQGALPPLLAQPLYVDPPQARPPDPP